jgi:hypothetical protein
MPLFVGLGAWAFAEELTPSAINGPRMFALVEFSVVNAPEAGVLRPIGVLLIEPPVIVAPVIGPLMGALIVDPEPMVTPFSEPPLMFTASERSLLSDW